MASWHEFRGPFEKTISLLKEIARYLKCQSCGGDLLNITTAGTEVDGNIPAGLKSFSLVKLSSNADTIVIELSDGSIYTMTELGEVFCDAASPNGTLPEYIITGSGTFKWHGIK